MVVPFMLLIVVLGFLDHFLPEPGIESVGSTNSVRSVAEIRPPMTTVAKGF